MPTWQRGFWAGTRLFTYVHKEAQRLSPCCRYSRRAVWTEKRPVVLAGWAQPWARTDLTHAGHTPSITDPTAKVSRTSTPISSQVFTPVNRQYCSASIQFQADPITVPDTHADTYRHYTCPHECLIKLYIPVSDKTLAYICACIDETDKRFMTLSRPILITPSWQYANNVMNFMSIMNSPLDYSSNTYYNIPCTWEYYK